MAIYSPLRSRRLAAQQTEATKRLITFKLGEGDFALPLDRVQKVTTLDRVYGDPDRTGVSLTTYQGRELVVIDVGHRIFGKAQQVLLPSQQTRASSRATQPDGDAIRYLLILQSESVETATGLGSQLVGLPIDSPPSIQSIKLSAFQPLPEIYRKHSNIHCVSAMSVAASTGSGSQDLELPSIFLLDATSIVRG
jgi:chemotaxis signal transduction protein